MRLVSASRTDTLGITWHTPRKTPIFRSPPHLWKWPPPILRRDCLVCNKRDWFERCSPHGGSSQGPLRHSGVGVRPDGQAQESDRASPGAVNVASYYAHYGRNWNLWGTRVSDRAAALEHSVHRQQWRRRRALPAGAPSVARFGRRDL